MENDITVKPATDPNAPKAFDIAFSQKLVRTAKMLQRSPSGEIIQSYASQLEFAIAALSGVAEKVNMADNNVTRYQREAENANADVTKMQREVADAREREGALKSQIDTLKAELESLRPKPKKEKKAVEVAAPTPAAPAPKKRGRPAKVLPMEHPKAANA